MEKLHEDEEGASVSRVRDIQFISSDCVYMGKNLPQKGKVHENNECLTALVIFVDLSF